MNVYWILLFLPKWVVTVLIAVGIVGLLATILVNKVPFIKTYSLLIKIVAIILLVAGFYLQGAIAYKDSTAVAVKKLEDRLAKAQVKSEIVNTQIVTKVVTQTQTIHEKGKTIAQYIDREVVKYNNVCEIPKEVIKAHNMAATLNTDDATRRDKQ